jgi:hypothetical protein
MYTKFEKNHFNNMFAISIQCEEKLKKIMVYENILIIFGKISVTLLLKLFQIQNI